MLCLAACVLFLVNFLISEHFFVMIVQVSPLLLLSVVCLQVEARPVKGNLLLPSVPSCHLLSCIPLFWDYLTVTTCSTPFSFYSIIKSKKKPTKCEVQGGIGSNLKVGSHLGRTAWANLRFKIDPKIVLKTILTRSGPIHHFLFGNQKLRCFDNCVSTQATAVGL